MRSYARPMKFGVKLPHTGPFASAEAIARTAVACEELGYHSLWVRDSLTRKPMDVKFHFTAGSMAAWERHEGPIVPDMYESVSTLCYVAGMTSRMELGSSVVILPLRHPVWLAKTYATLDRFCGGRSILGVGIGSPPYAKQEFAALGETRFMGRRGAVVDEWIAIMRQTWEQDSVDYDGQFITIRDAVVYPKPVQDRLPIVYGGMGDAVMHRIARDLDGWYIQWLPPERLAREWAELQGLAAGYGRAPSELVLYTEYWMAIDEDGDRARAEEQAISRASFDYGGTRDMPTLTPEQREIFEHASRVSLAGNGQEVLEKVVEYGDAGVDHMVLRPVADDVEHMIDRLTQFKEQVMDRYPGTVAA